MTQSTHHTVSDASKDICKIAIYLRSEGASKEDKTRKGDSLVNPLVGGSKNVAEGFLDSYLSGAIDSEDGESEVKGGEVDLDYELHEVI